MCLYVCIYYASMHVYMYILRVCTVYVLRVHICSLLTHINTLYLVSGVKIIELL